MVNQGSTKFEVLQLTFIIITQWYFVVNPYFVAVLKQVIL